MTGLSGQDPGPTAASQARARAAEAIQHGDFETALTLANSILPRHRGDADLHWLIAVALDGLGRQDEAVVSFNRAIKIRPDHVHALVGLAGAHMRLSEVGKAHRAVDRALAIDPDDGNALYTKVRVLRTHGQEEAALQFVSEALASGHTNAHLTIAFAELSRRTERSAEAIDMLRQLVERPDVEPNERRQAWFTLGHLYDGAREYDRAFEAFTRGNQMRPVQPADNLEDLKLAWSGELLSSLPRSGEHSDRPVFVVGMPRSGTTLTEQIIAAHHQCAGIGESDEMGRIAAAHPLQKLDEAGAVSCSKAYLGMLDRIAGKQPVRVADKMPENYKFLGLIDRILPSARVVHCVRDPRDVCLSCYCQNFTLQMGFSSDLRAVARQHVFHDGLMAHWREILDLRILTLTYEHVVADPEPQIRQLIEFLGVPFDDQCLRHHESRGNVNTASLSQVRQPIYASSAQRWRRYERHLGPMLEELEPILEGWESNR